MMDGTADINILQLRSLDIWASYDETTGAQVVAQLEKSLEFFVNEKSSTTNSSDDRQESTDLSDDDDDDGEDKRKLQFKAIDVPGEKSQTVYFEDDIERQCIRFVLEFAILRTMAPSMQLVQKVTSSLERIQDLYYNRRISLLYAHLYPLYFNLRGHFHKCLRFNKEALSDFSQAIELKEKYATALNNRASVYIEMNHLEWARADLEACLSLLPNYSVAWSNLGIVYYTTDNMAKTFECYDEAVRCDPNNANVLFNRSRARESVGAFVHAMVDMTYLSQIFKTRDMGIAELRTFLHQQSSDKLFES